MTKLAYIIPVFGEGNYTDRVICDLLEQGVASDIYIVDNKGDLDQRFLDEKYRWGDNRLIYLNGDGRRWLKGTNFGTKIADEFGRRTGEPYGAFVWLNNDVRLSPDFSVGIRVAVERLGGLCGVLGPSYDDVWPQQHCAYRGPAAGFTPLGTEHEARFVDGACMVIPAHTWEKLGPMDERFWQFGWGGDIDYCIRAREAGLGVWVTQRSYFNHIGGGTNKLLEENYMGEAGSEMHTGMLEKYGPGWDALLV